MYENCDNTQTGNRTKYVYDGNGNVVSKIMPAANSSAMSGRTATVLYAYDALNRLLSKTYPNDSANTPSSCYQYDVASVENGFGRLGYAWTQSGGCPSPVQLPASGFLTKRAISKYDSMGRVKSEQQCTKLNCSSPTQYSLNFNYDLIGNLTSYSDASGMQFNQTFDSVNRLLKLTRKLGGTETALFQPATSSGEFCDDTESRSWQYNALGQAVNVSFGSGLTISRAHDKRFRTTCEIANGAVNSASTSGTAIVTISGAEQIK